MNFERGEIYRDDGGFCLADYLVGPCPHCGGSGLDLDHTRLGSELRRQRTERGMTAKALAGHLHISAQYLCDLEYGRRHWSPGLVAEYRRVRQEEAP